MKFYGNIKILNLSNNFITDFGAFSIADYIEDNDFLEVCAISIGTLHPLELDKSQRGY